MGAGKALGEKHCERNDYPGVKTPATIIGCSAATMCKAVDRSEKLRAMKTDREVQRKGPQARGMTKGVAASTRQNREEDPVAAAAESTDDIPCA